MEKLLSDVKWATQRITLTIVVPTVVVGFPFVLAKLGELPGLWNFIDGLYPSELFWIALIVSRAVYLAAWILLGFLFVTKGEEWEFFWFKPDTSPEYSSTPSRDISGPIFISIILFAIGLVIAELAIRLSTGTVSPF